MGVCLCTMFMPPDLRGQKGALDALGLELQRVMNYCVGAGN